MYFPVRYLIASLAILAAFVSYICRYSLSVTIVAMVHKKPLNSTLVVPQLNESDITICPIQLPKNLTFIEKHEHSHAHYGHEGGHFEWSEATQGLVLGAFYYGYTLFQIIGGRMTEKFGAKWILGGAMLIGGIVNCFSPFLAEKSVELFILSRILLGVSQSSVFPSCYGLICKWIPVSERGTFFALVLSGGTIGTIVCNFMSGYLCKSNFLGGWPAVFYSTGLMCIAWFVIWIFIAKSDPKDHVWVSERELKIISAKKPETEIESNNKKEKQTKSTPWLQIFTSKAVLALIVAKFASHYAHNLIVLKAPTYLDATLRLKIDDNGIVNGILSVATAVFLTFGGVLSDWMIKKSFVSLTTLRKAFEVSALFGMAICSFLLPVFVCDYSSTITCLVLLMAAYGLVSGGDIPIAADMSSEYPATIYSIANTAAASSGFIAPSLASYFLGSNNQNINQWKWVFDSTGLICIFTGTVFLLYSSAKPLKFI